LGGGGVSLSRRNEDNSERKVEGGQVVNSAVNSRSGAGGVFRERRRGKLLSYIFIPPLRGSSQLWWGGVKLLLLPQAGLI
jgi:hypothetical protein